MRLLESWLLCTMETVSQEVELLLHLYTGLVLTINGALLPSILNVMDRCIYKTQVAVGGDVGKAPEVEREDHPVACGTSCQASSQSEPWQSCACAAGSQMIPHLHQHESNQTCTGPPYVTD